MLITYEKNGMLCQKEMGAEEIRKGQIALAVVKLRVLREGIKIHLNDIRSEIGNTVSELNKLDETLNLDIDEALMFYKELADLASDAAFRPKSRIKLDKARVPGQKGRFESIAEELGNISADLRKASDQVRAQRDLNDPNLDNKR